MARDFIKVDRTISTATHAQALVSFKDTLRSALEQGEKVLAIMTHNQDGSNFADLEALFGLAAGKGQTVFNLVNGAVGSMKAAFQTADAKNLTETLG